MAKKGTGIFVRVRNGDLDTALRVFNKKVKDSKLIIQIKENQYYEKPSVKKRRRRMASVLRNKHKSEDLE